jgi:hypothetical protein
MKCGLQSTHLSLIIPDANAASIQCSQYPVEIIKDDNQLQGSLLLAVRFTGLTKRGQIINLKCVDGFLHVAKTTYSGTWW